MKTTILIIIGAASIFFSCDKKEKAHLQSKIDSLNSVLLESKKTEATMNEIGVLLDSIDASRQLLHSKMTEGLSYADYINRLKGINLFIKDSRAKLTQLENSKKTASVTIRRLKNDLEARFKEIVSLQMDVINLRVKNSILLMEGLKKDSTISMQKEIIKLKNENVARLEEQAQEASNQNKIKLADLYFAQAGALEMAASRTKFAPRKKKETKREALELYKLSFYLGKAEAETRIEKLEKELE